MKYTREILNHKKEKKVKKIMKAKKMKAIKGSCPMVKGIEEKAFNSTTVLSRPLKF
jgi:hypothetical protein